jgi:hypothetical protein
MLRPSLPRTPKGLQRSESHVAKGHGADANLNLNVRKALLQRLNLNVRNVLLQRLNLNVRKLLPQRRNHLQLDEPGRLLHANRFPNLATTRTFRRFF